MLVKSNVHRFYNNGCCFFSFQQYKNEFQTGKNGQDIFDITPRHYLPIHTTHRWNTVRRNVVLYIIVLPIVVINEAVFLNFPAAPNPMGVEFSRKSQKTTTDEL